jgi:hypothetical protein
VFGLPSPPFNSNATYDAQFCAPTGKQSQIEAFGDTGTWNETAERAETQTVMDM